MAWTTSTAIGLILMVGTTVGVAVDEGLDPITEPGPGEYAVMTSDQQGGPAFSPISVGQIAITDGDDEVVTASLGFSFEYLGRRHDEVTVGVNGGLVFGSPTVSYETETLDQSDLDGVFPLWDDWVVRPIDGGQVRYGTVGSAPERVFVAEWVDLAPHGTERDSQTVTFQVQLRESDQSIEFHYVDVSLADFDHDKGAGATIGISGRGDGDITYSRDEAVLGDGFTIRFEPLD